MYVCFMSFVFVFLHYLVTDTDGCLAGIWHLPCPVPQPPPSRRHLHYFRPIFSSPFNPFWCIALLLSTPPPHGLCMTVVLMGSGCVCVCVRARVYVTVCKCMRASESGVHCCAPLDPAGRRRVPALGCCAVCARMRWDAAPRPGLCPRQALTKQQAGAGFVFNCDIWGVFARSPSPHPLSLTFLQQ